MFCFVNEFFKLPNYNESFISNTHIVLIDDKYGKKYSELIEIFSPNIQYEFDQYGFDWIFHIDSEDRSITKHHRSLQLDVLRSIVSILSHIFVFPLCQVNFKYHQKEEKKNKITFELFGADKKNVIFSPTKLFLCFPIWFGEFRSRFRSRCPFNGLFLFAASIFER